MGDKEKLYAKILLPVDITNIMRGKEKQGHITIYLDYIETIRDLEELCVLFNANRPKQAIMGIGTPIPDYEHIDNFTVSTLPSKYTNPAIAIAKSPLKYFYTKKEGVDIPVVLTNIVTSTERELLIKIDEKINCKYPVQHIYKIDETITRISELIEIVLEEKVHKIYIRCVECSDINFESVYRGAEIILAASSAESMLIENLDLGVVFLKEIKSAISENFLDYFKRIIRLGQILENLNIEKKFFRTKEVLEAEQTIYFLNLGLMETKMVKLPFHTEEDCGLYKQIIGHKKLLLEYERVEEKGYVIRNYLEEGKRIAILSSCSDGENFRISNWFALREADISEMIFDEKNLLKAMKDINEREVDQLLFLIFDCLKAYDKKKDSRMLSLAEKLFQIIEEYLDDVILLTINKLQIVARKRELNSEEKKMLIQFKYSKNISVRCCACILLGQFDEFDIHIQQLSSREKEEFCNWPIAALLPNKKIVAIKTAISSSN